MTKTIILLLLASGILYLLHQFLWPGKKELQVFSRLCAIAAALVFVVGIVWGTTTWLLTQPLFWVIAIAAFIVVVVRYLLLSRASNRA